MFCFNVLGGAPVPAGVVGSPSPAATPAFDPRTNQFNSGVKTDFPTFKPRSNQY